MSEVGGSKSLFCLKLTIRYLCPRPTQNLKFTLSTTIYIFGCSKPSKVQESWSHKEAHDLSWLRNTRVINISLLFLVMCGLLDCFIYVCIIYPKESLPVALINDLASHRSSFDCNKAAKSPGRIQLHMSTVGDQAQKSNLLLCSGMPTLGKLFLLLDMMY